MQIPNIPDYNGLIFSGCTINLMDSIEDGRNYGPVLQYETEFIPVFAVFDYVVKLPDGKMYNWPLKHIHRHLVADGSIDYFSFTSLN